MVNSGYNNSNCEKIVISLKSFIRTSRLKLSHCYLDNKLGAQKAQFQLCNTGVLKNVEKVLISLSSLSSIPSQRAPWSGRRTPRTGFPPYLGTRTSSLLALHRLGRDWRFILPVGPRQENAGKIKSLSATRQRRKFRKKMCYR